MYHSALQSPFGRQSSCVCAAFPQRGILSDKMPCSFPDDSTFHKVFPSSRVFLFLVMALYSCLFQWFSSYNWQSSTLVPIPCPHTLVSASQKRTEVWTYSAAKLARTFWEVNMKLPWQKMPSYFHQNNNLTPSFVSHLPQFFPKWSFSLDLDWDNV